MGKKVLKPRQQKEEKFNEIMKKDKFPTKHQIINKKFIMQKQKAKQRKTSKEKAQEFFLLSKLSPLRLSD